MEFQKLIQDLIYKIEITKKKQEVLSKTRRNFESTVAHIGAKKNSFTISKDYSKIEEDGFLVSKNLITRKNKRKCPTCGTFSFEIRDDLYMNKFDCCFDCYIQWVENREERWLKGWRPPNEKKE